MNAMGSVSPAMMMPTPTLGSDPMSAASSKDPEALARQFEGIFLSMLVKEMRQAGGMGEGMFPGDSSDTYGGIFDMYFGQHMAEVGGIGLAESLQKHFPGSEVAPNSTSNISPVSRGET